MVLVKGSGRNFRVLSHFANLIATGIVTNAGLGKWKPVHCVISHQIAKSKSEGAAQEDELHGNNSCYF